MGILTYKDDKFYLDSKPYVIMSGAMHYFRIPREYWRDRLQKLLECGLNTVETYTPWNLHEPKEGQFDFSGNLDIEAYIDTARELGLNVILRPGPYICAEWDMGGLPSWLLNYSDISLRCYDPLFLSKVENYYKELLSRIRPRLSTNGGNVFMLQIENEYGSFGDDKRYLDAVADIYKKEGMDCLLFTSDGPCLCMLSGGSMENYLCTGNFGSSPEENFKAIREYRGVEPFMCCEYWCGWFDHWGEEHHVRPPEEVKADIGEFLRLGASFNIYMFHGGTNFAFTNGANHDKGYQPTVTSYDYNAPLSEAGDRTPLYYHIRERIKESGYPVPEMTAKDSEKKAYGKVALCEYAPLFENLEKLSSPVFAPEPCNMEKLGQDFGYILYRTDMSLATDGWELHFDRVSDRAQIFINGEQKGVAERWKPETLENTHIGIPLKKGETARLDILCENMGRVNYGPKIRDPKGIMGVRFGNQYHFGWNMYPLPMKDLSGLSFKPCNEAFEGPAFFKGNLKIEGKPADTFIRLDGFTKGFVTVNGKNIGRYFNPMGPQKTLYVPAPFLREGDNEIIVFESDKTDTFEVELCDIHDLG